MEAQIGILKLISPIRNYRSQKAPISCHGNLLQIAQLHFMSSVNPLSTSSSEPVDHLQYIPHYYMHL